jgi:hypothetical protein
MFLQVLSPPTVAAVEVDDIAMGMPNRPSLVQTLTKSRRSNPKALK